ncbi:MAG: PH domain-containing protein, partial [Smithellaceae bacterium]
MLFVISLINGQRWEIIVTAVLFLTSLLACVDLVKRKITVSDQGLKIKNVFRSKEFGWQDITHLAVVVLKKKVYFLLTTTKGFYIFSNLFENHALLAGSL